MKNPYREGSMNHRIVGVLIRAKGPLQAREIAKRVKLPIDKTRTVLAALANPYHNAAGLKAGLLIERGAKGCRVRQVTPDHGAKRPRAK